MRSGRVYLNSFIEPARAPSRELETARFGASGQAPLSDRSRVDRLVSLLRTPDGFGVSVNLDLDNDVPLGLHVHSGERDAALRRLMNRAGGDVIRKGRLCHFCELQEAHSESLAAELRSVLVRIARKPISQKHVERILRITSAERIRWGKDGRLPRSGTAQIRRGTRISLWTYPPGIIEDLAARPEIVAGWRAIDGRP